MKKVIISITSILFSLLLVSCSEPKDIDIEKQKELRKAYNEMRIYAYTYKLGELDKDSEMLYEQYKLDDGNIVLELQRDSKTAKFFGTAYKYNKANRFVKIVRLDADDRVMYEEDREFYKGDTIIAKKTCSIYEGKYYLQNTPYKHVYTYDNKGNEVTYVNYYERYPDIYDGIISTTENIYNDEGELTQSTKIEKTRLMSMNPLKAVYGEPDTTVTYYKYGVAFVLDENGEQKYVKREDLPYGETFDESKLYTSTIAGTVKYVYNDNGLVIEKTLLNDKKEPTYTFKYDYK